ncbi:probable salivary secreted peptide [Nymphalis io]|uniref:probable salivary secreted peptide n=1 Tax=Inachis io TaxID=171585 RepID=UPI0021696CB0|nr:probable salivary secreted peptide [Nymphalis io]
MKQITLVILLVLFAHSVISKDLVLGSRINNLLVSTEKVVYKNIPLIKREKDYTYTDTKQRIIKGIIARDLSRSEAEVTVTAGGVGSTHVTLHLKSARGEGLNYLILIFSNNS